MEMEVDVSISLDGKRITGNVLVDKQEWEADPLQEVLNALQNQYCLQLSRFYGDRKVKVDYGETIGGFDMDMTQELDEDKLRPEMSWMAIDISESGEVVIDDSEYFMSLLKSLQQKFPVLTQYRICHMCQSENEMTIDNLIIHFNDNHEMSILEIADWLETLDADIGINYASSV